MSDNKQNTNTNTSSEAKETNPSMLSKLLNTNKNEIPSNKYIFEDRMNYNNKKAMNVMKNEGMEAAVEHMFKHPKTGKPMTYGEMRSFYG